MPLCPSCQAQVPADAKFCPSCGHLVAAEEAPTATHWSIPPAPPESGSRASQGIDGADLGRTQEQLPIGQSIPPAGESPGAASGTVAGAIGSRRTVVARSI